MPIPKPIKWPFPKLVSGLNVDPKLALGLTMVQTGPGFANCFPNFELTCKTHMSLTAPSHPSPHIVASFLHLAGRGPSTKLDVAPPSTSLASRPPTVALSDQVPSLGTDPHSHLLALPTPLPPPPASSGATACSCSHWPSSPPRHIPCDTACPSHQSPRMATKAAAAYVAGHRYHAYLPRHGAHCSCWR